jgi:ferric-dicitrate binding protein FerR (iron transport regulator)
MNDDLLIQRLLDGTLMPPEHAEFNQRLREDADLRQHLRDIAEQAVAMGDMARQRETDTPVCSPPTPTQFRADRSVRLTLAASIAVLATSAWLWLGSGDAPVLTLVDSSGTVVWNHGGEMRVNVSDGEKLAAGTLETLGETASAQLQFADGTIISLTGESELSFSEEDQKLLVLRKGSLSAQVKPQRPKHPMIVRTPSAEAEIVGTTFNLSARPDDTLLKVDEGLVRLKRLADGTSIDVPAQSSALASLNSSLKLDPAVTPEPLMRWRFDFTTTVPPQIWRGIWHDTPEGGRMVASPYVAQKSKEGAVITHFGVSIRTGYLNPPLALSVTEQSVIRYRLKQNEPAPLQLMLITNKPIGSFGGNFECKIGRAELRPDAGGWCELEIPISRFQLIDHRPHVRLRHPTPVGNIVASFLLSSFKLDTGLTVAHFELSTTP